MCNKWETLGLWFNVHCLWFLERNYFNYSYGRMTENVFDPLPLPSGVPMPMCFCGAPCKVAKPDEDDTYRQRYWMRSNFASQPTLRQCRINKMVRNWCCVIIILFHMKSCMDYLLCNICMYCKPSTALWFWAVDWHWDQTGRQGVDAELLRCFRNRRGWANVTCLDGSSDVLGELANGHVWVESGSTVCIEVGIALMWHSTAP
jgi:hypothetical protein